MDKDGAPRRDPRRILGGKEPGEIALEVRVNFIIANFPICQERQKRGNDVGAENRFMIGCEGVDVGYQRIYLVHF